MWGECFFCFWVAGEIFWGAEGDCLVGFVEIGDGFFSGDGGFVDGGVGVSGCGVGLIVAVFGEGVSCGVFAEGLVGGAGESGGCC